MKRKFWWIALTITFVVSLWLSLSFLKYWFLGEELFHRNDAVADVIDLAVLAQIERAVPLATMRFNVGPCELIEPGHAAIPDTELGRRFATCNVAASESVQDYCWFWWLGRKCLAVRVDADIFADPRYRAIVLDAVNNPCRYLTEQSISTAPADDRQIWARSFSYYRETLSCGTDMTGNPFDLFLVIGKGYGRPERDSAVLYFARTR